MLTRKLVLVGAGVAALALSAAGFAISQQSETMKSGEHLELSCPNQLTNQTQTDNAETVTCHLPTTTTTSTTVPASTTTTTVVPTGTTCKKPIWSSREATGTISLDDAGRWWANNDAWSGSHGPQTLSVCSASSWNAVSTQPSESGAVETYPDTEYDIGGRNKGLATETITQYSTLTSTFSEAFPSAGSWDAAYDLWLNNFGTEIMVWNEYTGTNLYYKGQGTAVTLDGVPYHLLNSGGGEFVFLRDTMVKSGSVDILAAFKVLVSKGLVKSTAVPTQLEYGVEICSTSGSETFPLTGLTFNLG
jgi:hypothetical protein